ncbi:Uncharacterised protein [Vibrio cholerae]|nr:Uncharacterised protein [Vibrio cholerae]CSA82780.1 Uncharacterised protein [Vibrio cholerae]CSB90691.1 Uncharacterised protein [Vibrio cholerae]CSC69906.1 Uncharacterised protein [Vibrio cholerae]CSI04769.1 Uncharacterised protein [Vibrio cholerae]
MLPRQRGKAGYHSAQIIANPAKWMAEIHNSDHVDNVLNQMCASDSSTHNTEIVRVTQPKRVRVGTSNFSSSCSTELLIALLQQRDN